ncbi:MAG: hypothetical protein AAF495_06330 [Pseudomonadota bacterium]
MTSRSKYYYALEEDWPDVLTALEDTVAVEYVPETSDENWTFPRFDTWREVEPIRKKWKTRFWYRYLLVPPGYKVVEDGTIRSLFAHPAAKSEEVDPELRPAGNRRPRLMTTPGCVRFDPGGVDEDFLVNFEEKDRQEYLRRYGTPYIEGGWLVAEDYDHPDTKRIYDVLVRTMQKRFANYKGTLFGPHAFKKIVEESWTFGQHGPLDWDITTAKKPRLWQAP